MPREIQTKRPNSILGVLMFLLLIAVISIVAFAVYLKTVGYDFSSLKISDAIDFINTKNQQAKNPASLAISFSQDGNVDVKVYKSYIIVLSQDGVKWYDESGKLLQERALTLTRPVLRTSKKYMAIIDIAGRDVYLYKDKQQLWTKKMDNQIINADVNDDGYFTVVTQSKEYKSEVKILDTKGAIKYTKICAEDIVLGAKSIHDGDDILLNKVLTKSVKAGTQFEFNSIYSEKSFATLNVADSVLPIVLTQGDNEVAVGQNLILAMDNKGREIWRKTADSIYCIAPNSGKYIVVAGKFTDASSSEQQKILVLNSKGEVAYSFDQPENISSISMHDDRLALRTQRSIYLYSLKGEKLGQYVAKNELKDVYLIGDNEAIIVSGGNISRVVIK